VVSLTRVSGLVFWVFCGEYHVCFWRGSQRLDVGGVLQSIAALQCSSDLAATPARL